MNYQTDYVYKGKREGVTEIMNMLHEAIHQHSRYKWTLEVNNNTMN